MINTIWAKKERLIYAIGYSREELNENVRLLEEEGWQKRSLEPYLSPGIPYRFEWIMAKKPEKKDE